MMMMVCVRDINRHNYIIWQVNIVVANLISVLLQSRTNNWLDFSLV